LVVALATLAVVVVAAAEGVLHPEVLEEHLGKALPHPIRGKLA
jgi:hypothetical protein